MAKSQRVCKNIAQIGHIIKAVLFLMAFHFPLPLDLLAQTIRIMPMGNSITYDESSYDVPPHIRPVGDRISYRYKLSQLISAAGYSFDFVGSEDAGNNYFQNAELDDNAGFPGLDKEQLAYLLKYGYNLRTSQQVTPGPYIQSFPADIVLLHIGTNNLTVSSSEIDALLDNIRNYDSDVIILVARIIDRATHSPTTTIFNDNVEAVVAAKNDPRIISVNMETGAGINYSTDMYDELHPNQNGYNKMAAKWFEVIDNLNTAPVVSSIPQQITTQGTGFANLSLDNYVTDAEDLDNLIQWTYNLQLNSKLSVSIDGNRIMHVSVTDNNWYGSETITLKAKDSGSGAFIKSDSTEIVFTVLKQNEPPVFTSIPVTNINEDNNYNYTLTASDNDGDILTYSAIQKPAWLTFSASTRVISGRPSNSEVGSYTIILRVTDGKVDVDQTYQLTVNNVNDAPVITSTPPTSIQVGDSLLYNFTATDIDVSDVLTFSFIAKPDWLSFTSGTEKSILKGKPSQANLGANGIILKVNDGHVDVIQGFTIVVTNQTGLEDLTNEKTNLLYPNPAQDKVFFKCSQPASSIRLQFYNITGFLIKDIAIENTDKIEIDISLFSKGVFLYKAFINDIIITGKLIKIN